jgi:hypothetical protein
MRIKWYYTLAVVIGILVLLAVAILSIVRPVNGMYINIGENCSCGHSFKYAVCNGLVIQINEGHNTYRLYGKYVKSGNLYMGTYYRMDGLKVGNFELVPAAFSLRIKSTGWDMSPYRMPVFDIEGYLKDKLYDMQGAVDPLTKRAAQLKLTYQQIKDWPN